MHFQLQRLRTRGFMGHDREVRFARGINVVVGPNGAGKTQLVESLRVLVRGTPSIVGATPDDLMLLARKDPDGYTIDGTWTVNGGPDDSGPVIRTISRNAQTNVVSQAISAPRLVSGSASVNMKKAALAQRLGAWAEAWHPLDWRKGGADLRRTLVSLLGGGSGLRPADFLPPDCPEYMLPIGEAEEIIDIWAEAARDRTRTAARMAEEALQQMVAVHADQADNGGVVADAQPIRDRLSRLHEERAKATTVRDQQRRLAADKTALDREQAQLSSAAAFKPDALEAQVARLDGELESHLREVARHRVESDAAKGLESGMVARLKKARDALAAHRGKAPNDEAGPQTPESVAAAEAAAAAAEAAYLPLGEQLDALMWALTAAGNDVIAAERVRVHLERCPDCGFDLRAHQAAELARLAKVREEADAAVQSFLPRAQEASAELTRAQGALRLARWQLEGCALQAELDAAEAAFAQRVAVEPVKTRDPRPDRDRVARDLAAARHAHAKAQALARRHLDLTTAEAELAAEAESLRPLEEIEADIERAEGDLEQALRGAQRLEDFRKAVAKKRAAAERAEATREWVPRMEAVYTRVMDSIRGAIEKPCSQISGADFRLVLVDPRGKPDCRLQRNGVDFATLSEGEQALATIAILRALGPTSGAEWRPVFVDRLQAIDALGRQRVAQAASEAIDAGEIDQVFLLGCIDVGEAVELVKYIDSPGCPASMINLGGKS